MTSVAAWLLGAAVASAGPSRPNVLFMMSDQQRHDTLGVVTPSLKTPNLDRIATEGARFVWGYTSTPTCTPARAALLTGLSPWHHGMLGAGAVAPAYTFEMPTTLASLGYSTTSIGKDHFGWVDPTYGRDSAPQCGPGVPSRDADVDAPGRGRFSGPGDGDDVDVVSDRAAVNAWCDRFFPPDKGHGVPHGYGQTSIYDGLVSEPDDYHQWFGRQKNGLKPESGWPTLDMNSWRGAPYAYANESLHPTAWVGAQAVSFITDRARYIVNASLRKAPWFLKVSFHRPHSPYDPPQRFVDAIAATSLRPVHTCDPTDPLAWDGRFSVNTKGNQCGPQLNDAWCGDMPANESVFARRCYQGSIAFIDEWVGKIFSALEQTDQLANTWMLWTADHGDGQADHFHWRKGFPYEFASHVPFLIRWPDGTADRRAAGWIRGAVIGGHVVELRDVFPTFLDAVGALSVVPPNHTLDGDSVLCLLGGANGTDGSGCRGGGWRPWLDLEHSTVYNETVHWNALFDGEMKYIFNAFFADGDAFQNQLFNLTADPHELRDLARSTEPADVAEVAKWRGRMAAQFTAEGRGAYGFVSPDGRLLQRTASMVYSPNYPGRGPSPPPGGGGNSSWMYQCPAGVVTRLHPGGHLAVVASSTHAPDPSSSSAPCMAFQYSGHAAGGTTLSVLGPSQTDASRLCIAAAAPSRGSAAGQPLTLELCGDPSAAPPAAVAFQLGHNFTAPDHARPQRVEHRPTGTCLALADGPAAVLEQCSSAESQLWVYGTSGRLCQGGLCLAAVAAPSRRGGSDRVALV